MSPGELGCGGDRPRDGGARGRFWYIDPLET